MHLPMWLMCLCVAFLAPSFNARLAFTSPCTPKSPFPSYPCFHHPYPPSRCKVME